jgi:hypothetical protein
VILSELALRLKRMMVNEINLNDGKLLDLAHLAQAMRLISSQLLFLRIDQ